MVKKKWRFEEEVSEIEWMAGEIEEGKIGLEESIVKYEQGMTLVKQCRAILSKAEQRIQKLQERSDGSLRTTPFAPERE